MKGFKTNSYYDLIPTTKTRPGDIVSSIFSALPMAVARPVLEYRRLDSQVEIILRAIEANEKTREDIMATIRELGIEGKLTPELTQYLFAAYNQTLLQLPV